MVAVHARGDYPFALTWCAPCGWSARYSDRMAEGISKKEDKTAMNEYEVSIDKFYGLMSVTTSAISKFMPRLTARGKLQNMMVKAKGNCSPKLPPIRTKAAKVVVADVDLTSAEDRDGDEPPQQPKKDEPPQQPKKDEKKKAEPKKAEQKKAEPKKAEPKKVDSEQDGGPAGDGGTPPSAPPAACPRCSPPPRPPSAHPLM